MRVTDRIAVIGAGWAGMAAAVELASRGRTVDVYEASRTLGGRARAAEGSGLAVDNGQHILIGAYRDSLRLMRTVGADPDRLLLRTPLHLEFPGEFRLSAPRLPAPFHTAAALLGAHGIDWREKWAAIRLMRGLQAAGFRVEPDCTVAAWLERHAVPSRQRRLLWEPLCVAALNTPAELASAQVMANVLRDSLAANREASDLLLPRADLSTLFPEPAARFVESRGGRVFRGGRIGPLTQTTDGWQLAPEQPAYPVVVLAVAPYHLPALLPTLADAVAPFVWEPIFTTYLAYPAGVRLPRPMLGVADGVAQWLFDRGTLCGQQGVLAAVISARGRHLALSVEELERRIHGEIAALLPGLPAPGRTLTITEKRASFSCTPGLRRPTATAGPAGIVLAGDYVAGEYPATLEGAVRSGIAAARLAEQATRR